MLKELRQNKKLSQLELANFVGVTQNAISKYENSKRIPDLETFDKICNALGLNDKKRMELLKSMSKKE